MRRIFVDRDAISNQEISLAGDAFHHAVQVLRLKVEDEFQVLAGDSILRTAKVVSVDKRNLKARVTAQSDLPALPNPRISLAVSLPRLNTFEVIVEKAVELGVYRIQPLFSDYSFIKTSKEISPSKIERLERIVRSATEQTCRGDLMTIMSPQPLREWLAMQASTNPSGKVPCLFAYEPIGQHLRLGARQQVKDLFQLKTKEVWALVGSEGGFSDHEVKLLADYKILPTSLGPQILRADTACAVTASILKYEFEQMG